MGARPPGIRMAEASEKPSAPPAEEGDMEEGEPAGAVCGYYEMPKCPLTHNQEGTDFGSCTHKNFRDYRPWGLTEEDCRAQVWEHCRSNQQHNWFWKDDPQMEEHAKVLVQLADVVFVPQDPPDGGEGRGGKKKRRGSGGGGGGGGGGGKTARPGTEASSSAYGDHGSHGSSNLHAVAQAAASAAASAALATLGPGGAGAGHRRPTFPASGNRALPPNPLPAGVVGGSGSIMPMRPSAKAGSVVLSVQEAKALTEGLSRVGKASRQAARFHGRAKSNTELRVFCTVASSHCAEYS